MVKDKRLKSTWKNQAEEESIKVGFRKMHFANQYGVLVFI